MKTFVNFQMKTLLVLVAVMFQFHLVWGKPHVNFHVKGNNLIVAVNEARDGTFTDFYVVKLISPLSSSLFTDGKYKIMLKKGVLVLVGKKNTLILSPDKSVLQTAFKQRRTYYILVNGIAKGNAPNPITAEDVFNSMETNKPFEKDMNFIDLGIFKLHIVSKNKNYFENLELGLF